MLLVKQVEFRCLCQSINFYAKQQFQLLKLLAYVSNRIELNRNWIKLNNKILLFYSIFCIDEIQNMFDSIASMFLCLFLKSFHAFAIACVHLKCTYACIFGYVSTVLTILVVKWIFWCLPEARAKCSRCIWNIIESLIHERNKMRKIRGIFLVGNLLLP